MPIHMAALLYNKFYVLFLISWRAHGGSGVVICYNFQ